MIGSSKGTQPREPGRKDRNMTIKFLANMLVPELNVVIKSADGHFYASKAVSEIRQSTDDRLYSRVTDWTFKTSRRDGHRYIVVNTDI